MPDPPHRRPTSPTPHHPAAAASPPPPPRLRLGLPASAPRLPASASPLPPPPPHLRLHLPTPAPTSFAFASAPRLAASASASPPPSPSHPPLPPPPRLPASPPPRHPTSQPLRPRLRHRLRLSAPACASPPLRLAASAPPHLPRRLRRLLPRRRIRLRLRLAASASASARLRLPAPASASVCACRAAEGRRALDATRRARQAGRRPRRGGGATHGGAAAAAAALAPDRRGKRTSRGDLPTDSRSLRLRPDRANSAGPACVRPSALDGHRRALTAPRSHSGAQCSDLLQWPGSASLGAEQKRLYTLRFDSSHWQFSRPPETPSSLGTIRGSAILGAL